MIKDKDFEPFLIGVYGTLKKGHSNHHLIDHCHYLGECISENDYTMYSVNDWYPAVVFGGEDAILMEVFRVDDKETADNLDRLEGYPSLYIKDIIKTPYGNATIYLFNRKVDNLNKVKSVSNWVL